MMEQIWLARAVTGAVIVWGFSLVISLVSMFFHWDGILGVALPVFVVLTALGFLILIIGYAIDFYNDIT